VRFHRRPSEGFVAGWIIFCVYCNMAGWVLSAFHRLNAAGYTVAFLAGMAALVVWWRRTGALNVSAASVRKLCKRFRRLFPMAFLVLSALVILSGCIYPPNNHDALAYRVPRVLNWLAEGRWHWIHTEFPRLNNRACGIEWVSAPLLAFTETHRWLFLVNVVCFLTMPGLVFSVFTRLGVNRRVAWTWMWLLPTGYCYLLQAGGLGNDLFATFFPLAALHFALRAAARQSIGDAWLAILGAALATSAKTSNLPLVLPVAAALFPCWRVLARNAAATSLVALLAISASFLPTAVLNARYCGDWTGAKAEHLGGLLRGSILLRTANSSFYLALLNTVPPIFPWAQKWNQAVAKHMPPSLQERLHASYAEEDVAEWSLVELQSESRAGLGAGLTGLLLAGFAGTRKGGRFDRNTTASATTCQRWLVLGAFFVAFLIYLASWTMSCIGRLTAPYYPLVACALLLAPGHTHAVRRNWWRALAGGALWLSLLLLCITPPRPLWPAETVLGTLLKKDPSSRLLKLAKETYQVNRLRADAFAPVRAAIPKEATVVGMITADDPETSMWMPFGSRIVLHIKPADTGDEIRRRGICYIAIRRVFFERRFDLPLDQWLAKVDGKIIQTISLTLNASVGPQEWCLVALNPASPLVPGGTRAVEP
jgi:hypothetical protein